MNSFIQDIKLKPIKTSSNSIVLSITAGISYGPKFIEECEFAIKYARHNKLEVVFYAEHILEELIQNNLVKNVIAEGSPLVYYQPIADQNKKIVKYEALLRMKHGDSIYYPDSFLKTSKNIKLYNLLTKKVVAQAYEDFKNRNEKVSINLSFEDIDNKEINEYIKNISKEYANIKKVDFEITESDAIKDYKKVQEFINAITNLGASFSIDDFGIGYSNFGILRDLERIETIKIDGEFVRNYKTNNRYKILLENIVNLAKKMDIKIVAEYVENEEIFNTMKELGVDYFQGYYIGKPHSIEKYLKV
ncbi:EAL domain-containing protein [Aliarcobacter lanthieri]|uniref:EAL domain-containing protein n=1 Tax=Aliarcobacter lanthieri TaxID=1355374 RepID=UPI003AB094B7